MPARQKQKIEIRGPVLSILPICDEWPESWMGVDEDVPYGRQLVEAMKPFIESLIASNISARVMKKHLDDLWLLGGEIIRDVSLHEDYEKIAAAAKLWEAIGPHDGPYCRHLHTASEQQSYDATCGKLHRFLKQSRSGGFGKQEMREMIDFRQSAAFLGGCGEFEPLKTLKTLRSLTI